MSSIMVPGSPACHKEQKKSYLVLFVSSFGFLVWRTLVTVDGGRRLSFGLDGQESLSYQVVDKFSDWRALPIHISPPGMDGDTARQSSACLEFVAGKKGAPALVFGAYMGLPKINVHNLKQLFRALEVPARMPVTEVPLVTAIIKHLVPDISEAELKAAVHGMGGGVSPSAWSPRRSPRALRRRTGWLSSSLRN